MERFHQIREPTNECSKSFKWSKIMEGYQPRDKIKNSNPPKSGSGVPNKKQIILMMKDIDKLHIYFTDREIAHILWFG